MGTPNFVVVIPTRNTGPFLDRLLPALAGQTRKADRLIVIDTTSSDGTAEAFRRFGGQVHTIPPTGFDHGGTRQLGMSLAPGAELILYLTQDAIPADRHAFARLLEAFDDPRVAVAYGRQLPHPGASPLASQARGINYPEVSSIYTLTDVRRVGIRAAFCSDCFAAYRRAAVIKVGGFPAPVIWGEDALLAAKLLLDGWANAYVAEAAVYHSHDYSLIDYFRSSFDAGVMHAHETWFMNLVGSAHREGMRFALGQLVAMAHRHPAWLPRATASLAARYLGYLCGRRFALVPTSLRLRLTWSSQFLAAGRCGEGRWRLGPNRPIVLPPPTAAAPSAQGPRGGAQRSLPRPAVASRWRCRRSDREPPLMPQELRACGENWASTHTARPQPAGVAGQLFHAAPDDRFDPIAAVLNHARLLWRHKLLIALVMGLAGLAAFGLSVLQVPIFRAASVIEVQGRNQDFLNLREVDPAATDSFGPEGYMDTQLKVLKSRVLAAAVVNRLALDRNPTIVGANPEGEPAPHGLLGHLGLPDPQWRAVLGLPPVPQAGPHETAIQYVADGLEVEYAPPTRIFDITFDDPDPKLAAQIVNTLADAYIRETTDAQLDTIRRTGDLLFPQLSKARQTMEASERRLGEYARSVGLVITEKADASVGLAEERVSLAQSALAEAKAKRIAAQSAYERATSSPPDVLPEVVGDEKFRDLVLKLVDLRQEAARLEANLAANHPRVKEVRSQIATLEHALERERDNIVSSVRENYKSALRRERLLIESYDEQVHKLSNEAGRAVELAALRREVASNRALYDRLLETAKEIGVASAVRASTIRIVEPAEPPRLPFRPRITVNVAVGLLAGMMSGAFFVLLCGALDRTLRAPGAISRHLDVPELGAIPQLALVHKVMWRSRGGWLPHVWYRRFTDTTPEAAVGPARSNGGGLAREQSVWQNGSSIVSDSFHSALTSILLSVPRRDLLSFVVTSSQTGDGKTTVASNLAIAFAEIGYRTLLIDADLRKPSLHTLFGVLNDRGLADVLGDGEPIQNYPSSLLYRASIVPGLMLLTAGGPCGNPAGLLASSRLDKLLARARAEFSAVVVDTTPIFLPDARRASAAAGAAILVFRASTTMLDQAVEIRAVLAQDGTHVLGGILNGCEVDIRSRRYYDVRHGRHA